MVIIFDDIELVGAGASAKASQFVPTDIGRYRKLVPFVNIVTASMGTSPQDHTATLYLDTAATLKDGYFVQLWSATYTPTTTPGTTMLSPFTGLGNFLRWRLEANAYWNNQDSLILSIDFAVRAII